MSGEERKINDTIFWIEVDKISPNPFQPRKVFDEAALNSLSESIRQYGVLQPLVVTRKEVERSDGGFASEYELIAGERRLRASKLAGVKQVPAVIRSGEETNQMKLELAIIENLQREDLNPVDRALAFDQLAKEFGYKPAEIGKKIGMSREYVANSIRILKLPDYILDAIRSKQIADGHTKPLLMLVDRPEELEVLFKDVLHNRLTVRETERMARLVAVDKVRRKGLIDPEVRSAESKLSERLGAKVLIEGSGRDEGGKIVIRYFNKEDLRSILENMEKTDEYSMSGVIQNDKQILVEEGSEQVAEANEQKEADPDDSELYSVSNFSV